MSAAAHHSGRAWAAGDVAVCIGHANCPDGQWTNTLTGDREAGPATGQYVRVTAVEPWVQFQPPDVGLEFAEFPGALYPASAFRRIEPDAEAAENGWLDEAFRRYGAKVAA